MRFEAWRCGGKWRGSPRALRDARASAAGFFRSCGRTQNVADVVTSSIDGRAVVVPSAQSGQPDSGDGRVDAPALEQCGLTVVRRRAVAAIAELFAEDRHRPRALALCDVAGSGISTVIRELARSARLNGFIPISLDPSLVPLRRGVAGRSLFVIAESPGSGDAWTGFLDLVMQSPKPHVLLFVGPAPVPHVETIHLERLSAEALAQAVKPALTGSRQAKRILAAARRARGMPGRFAQLIWGLSWKRRPSLPSIRISVAAEEMPVYGQDRGPSSEICRSNDGRGWADPGELASLRKKLEAAVGQLSRGRHAPGERALRAALAGLARRHDWARAAQGGIALSAALLRRGRVRDARQTLVDATEYSRRAEDDSALADVAILSGVAWMEQGRLDEAESLLTASLTAATSKNDPARTASACLALGRCLFWSARFDASSEMLARLNESELTPDVLVRRLLGLSRASVGRRDFEAGIQHGVAAAEAAGRSGSPLLIAKAAYGLAFAHLAVGDKEAVARDVASAIRAARQARDPLCALRARLIGAENERRAGRLAAGNSLVARIARIPSGNLPVTIRARGLLLRDLLSAQSTPDAVRRQVASTGLGALALFAPLQPGERRDIRLVVDDLVDILQASQAGDDDKAVLTRVSALVRARLQAATVAFFATDRAGNVLLAWDGSSRLDPGIVSRVGAAGQTIAPHAHHDLVEAGSPVRYGGEIIGVCVARWTLGSSVDATRASLLLTTAATAVGPALAGAVARRTERQVHDPVELVGVSPSMEEVRRAVERAASAPFPVLIEGESGSGKELVARALHRRSSRRDRPFCALNCAALPDDLVEAELFGHARGAFTGAVSERPGVFEEAHTGTLFLDEIGELTPRAQAKVLRTIQEGELRRVGENVSRRVDVRIVSATNRDLRQETSKGRFRLDLLYRLDVVRITLPPLRDRREDVALLVERYWREASERVGSRAMLSAATLASLARYDWPGNVRELQNVLAALAVRCPRRGVVAPDALPPSFGAPARQSPFRLDEARRTFEERFVRAALVRSGGHRGRTATELGVTRQGLSKLMVRLGISESPAQT
jgi:DNA-binding NtrC family response regulator/tetratricopeptide (TPR) repeat protein